MAEIFTEELYMPNGRKLSMLKNFDHIKAIFGSYQGHVLKIYTISIFLEEWNGSIYFCIALQGQQGIRLSIKY